MHRESADRGDDVVSPETYAEIQRKAEGMLRGMGRADTVDPASLAHDAFLRLSDRTRSEWKSRSHFLTTFAQIMRQALVDRARKEQAIKRGGGRNRHAISTVELAYDRDAIDVLTVHELLERLARVDPRQARIVELKFFGGLTTAEIAGRVGASKTTVEDEWRHARAWLLSRLDGGVRTSGDDADP